MEYPEWITVEAQDLISDRLGRLTEDDEISAVASKTVRNLVFTKSDDAKKLWLNMSKIYPGLAFRGQWIFVDWMLNQALPRAGLLYATEKEAQDWRDDLVKVTGKLISLMESRPENLEGITRSARSKFYEKILDKNGGATTADRAYLLLRAVFKLYENDGSIYSLYEAANDRSIKYDPFYYRKVVKGETSPRIFFVRSLTVFLRRTTGGWKRSWVSIATSIGFDCDYSPQLVSRDCRDISPESKPSLRVWEDWSNDEFLDYFNKYVRDQYSR